MQALRKKRALMINQPQVVSNCNSNDFFINKIFLQTAEEIDEYFDKLERRIGEERAEKKLLASQKEVYKQE